MSWGCGYGSSADAATLSWASPHCGELCRYRLNRGTKRLWNLVPTLRLWWCNEWDGDEYANDAVIGFPFTFLLMLWGNGMVVERWLVVEFWSVGVGCFHWWTHRETHTTSLKWKRKKIFCQPVNKSTGLVNFTIEDHPIKETSWTRAKTSFRHRLEPFTWDVQIGRYVSTKSCQNVDEFVNHGRSIYTSGIFTNTCDIA